MRAVTAVIGGGSPNTVLKLLSDWKAGRPVVRIDGAELDARIVDAIKSQMQRVAEQSAAAAKEQAETLAEDLQTVAEAQAAGERQIAALLIELETAKAQLHEAQADKARAIEQAVAERQRLEVVSADLVRAQVRLEAIPDLKAEIERLRPLGTAPVRPVAAKKVPKKAL